MLDPVTNPVPVTVRVNADPPAIAVLGDIPLVVGAALPLILNVRVPVVPPPGDGLDTATVAEPILATSLEESAMVNCAALTNVVVRAALFHNACDVETKPLPFTVNVSPEPPAITELGESDVICGTEFPVTVKVCPLDVPPPGVGVWTVTVCAP